MALSDRIVRRVARDFPDDHSEVMELLDDLIASLNSGQSPERLAAAVVLYARGRVDALMEGMQLAYQDWRDLLVEAGLGHDDWSERMDREFGKE
ncbi:hypothetical protein [Streptomyces asiaticus]